jgi:hypothetical protein
VEEASLEAMREKAHGLASRGKNWHFHILTPNCLLNLKQRYAFIFEDVESKQYFVHYSDQMESELGRELAPMLHGEKVLQREEENDKYAPSETVQHMLSRAGELSKLRMEWHHHLLFPGCQYNKNASKYTLVFEDPETRATIENTTGSEPSDDLKLIEKLFYAQKS